MSPYILDLSFFSSFIIYVILGYAGQHFIDLFFFAQCLGQQKTLPQLKQLSNRELEVAQLLVNGQGILDIATLLNVQSNTVSTYKLRIFEKLRVQSVPGLVAVFHNFTNLHPDNH